MAVVLFAGFVGLPVGALAATGFVPTMADATTTLGSLTVTIFCGVLAGATAGLFVRYLRRGWAELEGLGDVERLAAIRAVHFGTDIGSSELAAATVEFARQQRTKVEAKRWDPISFICMIFGVQFVFASLTLILRGAWLHGVAGVGLSVMLLATAGRGYQLVKSSGANLWNAEWYAAQRLSGTTR